MKSQGHGAFVDRTPASLQGGPKLVAALIFVLLAPVVAIASCLERPTVWMDERTAESHFLSEKGVVQAERVPELARTRTVIVIVTVDREGVICDAQAVAGRLELRKQAAKVVKGRWRYRPFLVDWKPVVAQFPVKVVFLVSQRNPQRLAHLESAMPRPAAERGP